MNGFTDHGLDEDAFGEKGNLVSAFDAFPKSKPQYITRTSGGGKWTVAMLIVSTFLSFNEISHWWRGHENHTVSVEKAIGHDLQINFDMVVAMKCDNIHINVQDAAGDRILAGDMLKRDATIWNHWVDAKGVHALGKDENGKVDTGEGYHDHEEGFGEEHVHDIISSAGNSRRAKFAKTPRLWGGVDDSCRVYGKLEVNKVQGDFHITARGHGYQEWGAAHLDHDAFNFSHIVSELSFGQFYPSLQNPLDRTIATTPNHFHKFQYFLSIVPTIYTAEATSFGFRSLFTNQYAVTEQSHEVNDHNVPGIFFKYDIEPMLITVDEYRDGFLRLAVKLVNVCSGVMVAFHWGFTLSEWLMEVIGKRRKRMGEGVLTGKVHERYD
ncbi:hypothetical protein HYALB_00011284 [Hymenoscyphus albidus]|uniref:Endoplasmic reticulum-Golgi intermediate compartment protein n=1 Tax=Hymenoscyphus albidus TaxID=595503 RepID=A0A9N9LTE3_9HELO|nr:hypothetical protein HYALB_00011284 [Hymenoscyphus albidus]